MATPKDVLQTVDDDARRQVRTLIDDAQYASLAALEPDTGHPLCSRVGLATDESGARILPGTPRRSSMWISGT